MNYRTPLHHLLRTLTPAHHAMATETPASEFMDTLPNDDALPPVPRPAATAPVRLVSGWAESALDLAAGTEIMEYPDDTAADLMDQFFAKRAA